MCNGVVEGFDPASEFLQVGKRESLQQADDAPQQEQLRGILDHQHARQHEQITHGLRLCRKGEKRHAVPEPHDVVILRKARRALAFALLGRGREDGVVIERGRNSPHHLPIGGKRLHAQYLLEIERRVDERSEFAVECVDLFGRPGSASGQRGDFQRCHGIGLILVNGYLFPVQRLPLSPCGCSGGYIQTRRSNCACRGH